MSKSTDKLIFACESISFQYMNDRTLIYELPNFSTQIELKKANEICDALDIKIEDLV